MVHCQVQPLSLLWSMAVGANAALALIALTAGEPGTRNSVQSHKPTPKLKAAEIEELLKHGAQVRMRCPDGREPLDFAADDSVKELLLVEVPPSATRANRKKVSRTSVGSRLLQSAGHRHHGLHLHP